MPATTHRVMTVTNSIPTTRLTQSTTTMLITIARVRMTDRDSMAGDLTMAVAGSTAAGTRCNWSFVLGAQLVGPSPVASRIEVQVAPEKAWPLRGDCLHTLDGADWAHSDRQLS